MKSQIFSLFAATSVVLLANSAQASTFYSSSFESDQGGWSESGDWERGIPTGFTGGFSSVEPSGGFSGDFAFGTVIGGDHSPSTISSLTQTFDFSGLTDVSLSFYEWIESGSNAFDEAKVFVGSTEVYFSDGDSNSDWRLVSLDLSAFDNQSDVSIEFQFSSTSVVERVGWYIDDVKISAADTNPTPVPEPVSTAALFGLAGVSLVTARKRK